MGKNCVLWMIPKLMGFKKPSERYVCLGKQIPKHQNRWLCLSTSTPPTLLLNWNISRYIDCLGKLSVYDFVIHPKWPTYIHPKTNSHPWFAVGYNFGGKKPESWSVKMHQKPKYSRCCQRKKVIFPNKGPETCLPFCKGFWEGQVLALGGRIWTNERKPLATFGKLTQQGTTGPFSIGFSSKHWVSKQAHLPRIQVLNVWRSTNPK